MMFSSRPRELLRYVGSTTSVRIKCRRQGRMDLCYLG